VIDGFRSLRGSLDSAARDQGVEALEVPGLDVPEIDPELLDVENAATERALLEQVAVKADDGVASLD
jgi:hypothetical protein